jgi:hypothetical protein
MLRLLVVTLVLATAAPAVAQTAPVTSPAGYSSGSTYAAPPPSDFAPYDRRGRRLVGTRRETQNDRGLWGAGLGLFIAGWVLDIAGTAIFNAVSNDRLPASEEDAMAWSIVPWFGPIIQLAIQAPHPALPLVSGLMQIGGTILFVLGLTSEHEAEVPIYAFGDPHDPATARIGLDVAPTEGGAYATVTLHTL